MDHSILYPIKIRLQLAKSYVVPTLLYGAELFAGCNADSRKKLNTTFNNVARYVFGIRKYDRISHHVIKILKMPLNNYLNYKAIIFLHKIIYTREPNYLFQKLTFSRSNRGNNLNQIIHRRQLSERQFFIRTIRLWNLLPNEIQTIRHAIKFKKSVFEYYATN